MADRVTRVTRAVKLTDRAIGRAETATSRREAGSRDQMTEETSWWKTCERPKSPCGAPSSQCQCRTRKGSSKP
ncbi:hypothetical protein ACFV2Q_23405 [Streptomyces sp. NPDC059650]|uniref:hypothetical protein n=1 Tax=Streptomyces sp. NPDC059650 TaxID=3346896 RepID=UPI0036B6B6E2